MSAPGIRPGDSPVRWQLLDGDIGGEDEWRKIMVVEAMWRVSTPHLFSLLRDLIEIDPRVSRRIYEAVTQAVRDAGDVSAEIDHATHAHGATPSTLADSEAKFIELVHASDILDVALRRALLDLEYQAETQRKIDRLRDVVEA